jgi:hypothetical protein
VSKYGTRNPRACAPKSRPERCELLHNRFTITSTHSEMLCARLSQNTGNKANFRSMAGGLKCLATYTACSHHVHRQGWGYMSNIPTRFRRTKGCLSSTDASYLCYQVQCYTPLDDCEAMNHDESSKHEPSCRYRYMDQDESQPNNGNWFSSQKYHEWP